eukprot:Ihof_evm6s142 gene=Ihof_evmTU6s142
MWSWLKMAGPGTNLPYEIGEALPCQHDPLWTLHSGKRKADDTDVSIFVFDGKNNNMMHVAKNALKRAKTLKHPNFLRFIDSYETETSVMIITEPTTPLATHLVDVQQGVDENHQTRQQLELEIKWGLHQVLKALSFLNNDCKLVHNGVGVGSIYVDQAGEWKLGGLDFVCSPTSEDCTALLAGMPRERIRYRAPEVQKNGLTTNVPLWAADIWSLGIVLWETFNPEHIGRDFTADQLVSNTGNVPVALLQIYKDMVSPNPRSRPDPAIVLEMGLDHKGYLRGSFVDTCLFLEEIQLKDSEEKIAYFKKLPSLISQYPSRFQKYKILPELVKALMYGGANANHVLSLVLQIGKLLTGPEYTNQVVPCVIKLFGANDRATRMSLLQQLDLFAAQLREDVINNTVFAQIGQGFTDTLPAMREASVKASLVLAPKLTERTITTVLLPHFARLQVDPEPGIRTNTTICLGKMAVHFSEATRNKVLAVAFSRALRDPFLHARVAGLMAFMATQEFYNAETIANKIVPALAPVCLDSEGEVRTQAFKALGMFVQLLHNYADAMPATAMPPQGSPVNGNAHSSDGSKPLTATGMDGGWAGWAMNSLVKAVVAGKDTPVSGNLASPSEPTVQKQSFSPKAPAGLPHSPAPSLPRPTPNITDNTDAWNEDNGWDEADEWEPIEKVEPAKQSHPVPKSTAQSWDNDGWGNDADGPGSAHPGSQ